MATSYPEPGMRPQDPVEQRMLATATPAFRVAYAWLTDVTVEWEPPVELVRRRRPHRKTTRRLVPKGPASYGQVTGTSPVMTLW